MAEGTADGLDQLEQRFEGFKVEKLAGNEVFVSAAIHATRAAAANIYRKSGLHSEMRC